MRGLQRAALLACGLATVSCGEEKGAVAPPELFGLDADQVIVGLEHRMTRDGVLKARLNADTAYVYRSDARIRLRNLEIGFFGEDGTEMSVLTADHGTYDIGTDDMVAHGNVVVVDQVEDRRLETERLRFDKAADQLVGDTAFVMTQGSSTTRGDSFTSDPNMNIIDMAGPTLTTPGVAPID